MVLVFKQLPAHLVIELGQVILGAGEPAVNMNLYSFIVFTSAGCASVTVTFPVRVPRS